MTDLDSAIRSTLADQAQRAPAFAGLATTTPTKHQRWAPLLTAAAVLAVVALAIAVHTATGPSTPPVDGTGSTAGPTPSVTGSGPQTCTSDQLDVGLGPVEGAAGTGYHGLEVTNTAQQPCVLAGLPSITLSGGDLTAPLTVQPGGTLIRAHVTLDPGATVTLPVAVAVPDPDNWQPPGPCAPATPDELLVTFGTGPSTSLPWTDAVCSGDQGTPYLTSAAPGEGAP